MTKFLKNNSVAIIIVTIFLAVYGVIALFTIPKEAQPSINIPYYFISFSYLGADPSSIEEQITIPLEQRLKSLSAIKNITASSYYNFGTILIEFDKNKSDVDATNDIKAVIDEVWSRLSSDVKTPVLKKIDITDSPVYSFSIVGSLPTQVLYEEVKSLEDYIKAVPGVSGVDIIGKPTKEIQIVFDLQKLWALNLDFSMIVNQLKSAFVKFPVDKKIVDGKLYSFEIVNYDANMTVLLDQIAWYTVVSLQWKTIKIRDIAQVYVWYKQQEKKSFIVNDINNPETKNALSFHIKKSPWYSLWPLVDSINSILDEYKISHSDLEFVETLSQEETIKKTYGIFISNFWQTGLLVFIIILLFLWARSSFVIFFSFFIVYLTNFIYLKSIGYSFNNIVSFALILVLGIMVDNLIVITQGIVTWLEEHSGDLWKAIGYSLRIYAKPVIFGTLTTIAVFIPLYFGLTGVMGEYIRSMPVTVISNLVISLIVTLLILPVIASLIFKSWVKFIQWTSLSFLKKIGDWLWSLVYLQNITKSRSFVVIVVFVLWLFGSLSLLISGWVKFSFMGSMDSDNVRININYSPGISLDDNQKYTAKVADASMKYFQTALSGMVQEVAIDIGQWYSLGQWYSPGWWWTATSHLSSFTIKLIPTDNRDKASYEIVEQIQQELFVALQQKYAFIEDMTVFTLQAWWGWGKPVAFNIVGEDYQAINTYIQTILPDIAQIPGIFNVGASIAYTNGKIVYTLDENITKELWANSMSVVMNMLALQNSEKFSNGVLVNEFSEFWSEVLPLKAFLKTTIPIQQTKIGNYTLDQIIKTQELTSEINAIGRINWKRSIGIQADKLSHIALADITSAIDLVIQNTPLPVGMEYTSGWDIQQLDDATNDMKSAMIIGLVLMLLVLIIQFNSFKYAALIILSILFSFWGIVIILAITWFDLTFPAMIAIFWVFGVGVNQMLILLEAFNYYYKEKLLSVAESFQESIWDRFVPIFLTNTTTIIGLSILAFKDELFWSMAIAFIWWLLASVVIWLFLLPAFMNLFTREYYNKW